MRYGQRVNVELLSSCLSPDYENLMWEIRHKNKDSYLII